MADRTKGRYRGASPRATAKAPQARARSEAILPRYAGAIARAEAKLVAAKASLARRKLPESRREARAQIRRAEELLAATKARAAPPKPKAPKKRPKPKAKPKPKRPKPKRAVGSTHAGAVSKATKRFVRALDVVGRRTEAQNREIDRARSFLKRALEHAGLSPSTVRSRIDAIVRERRRTSRSIVEYAQRFLPAAFNAKHPRDAWQLRHSNMTHGSKRFEEFMQAVQEDFDLEHQEAVDVWFSPEAA